MNTEKKVKAILSELSGEKTVSEDTILQGDLALDSLSMVMLLVEIEEAFKIQLNESDMNPFDLITAQSVIDMVRRYCGDDE